MRLWSLDPRYLDAKGLVACWREALLAQAVLAGRTKGYTHHPQLARFQESQDPLGLVGAYLEGIAAEATRRGYHFDTTRIIRGGGDAGGTGLAALAHSVEVPSGQIALERQHLLTKLRQRSPDDVPRLLAVEEDRVEVHPLFRRVHGGVADWERAPQPPRS